MLAVSLPDRELGDWLGSELSLAAVNGPGSCVASGPHPAIADLARRLGARDIACRPLLISHAFHSAMMEPVLEPFLARLREVEFHAPGIPFVSNLTGTWIEAAEATDPGYWARHLRHAVRFADGLDTLLREPGRFLIEVGPGNTLGTLVLRHTRSPDRQTVVTSLRHPHEEESEIAHLLDAAGKVWLAGASLDWPAFYAGQQRRRVPLPCYPFQRQRYWIDPPALGERPDSDEAGAAEREDDIGDWFYVPSWQRTPPPVGAAVPGTRWLLFVDDCGVGAALAERLARLGIHAMRVQSGTGFARRAAGEFALDPAERSGYGLLFDALHRADAMPDVVVHLWNLTAPDAQALDSVAARGRSFHSLVFLAQALGERETAAPCRIAVVSNGLHQVTGEESLDPAKALLL
ncbi:MAG: KR prefix domain-containing protein, partial [Gammaproteobacteria bacterium]